MADIDDVSLVCGVYQDGDGTRKYSALGVMQSGDLDDDKLAQLFEDNPAAVAVAVFEMERVYARPESRYAGTGEDDGEIV